MYSYNGLANQSKYSNIHSSSSIMIGRSHYYRPIRQSRELTYKAPHLPPNKKPLYGNSIDSTEDNRMTDYGFAPWQRPNTVCGGVCGGASTSTREPNVNTTSQRHQYTPNDISWNTELIHGNSGSLHTMILHV